MNNYVINLILWIFSVFLVRLLTTVFLLFLFTPDSSDIGLIYFIPFIWGFSDGLLMTQINSELLTIIY